VTLALETVLASRCLHVAVDMQRLFAEHTVWQAPALAGITARVEAIARHAPADTVLTRFVTPAAPEDANGAWRGYYRHWREVTLERMSPDLLDIVEPLAALAPPARVCDKTTHSGFTSGGLAALARDSHAGTLVLTGVETDVCVLGTALDAVDLGYHVVVVEDAVASSVPASHRAVIDHLLPRFDQQIVVTTTAALLAAWVPR